MGALNWQLSHDGADLYRARVKCKTVDGYDATVFILTARAGSWDVQTVDHSVLAHGSSTSLEDAQSHAHTALWTHVRSMAERIAL